MKNLTRKELMELRLEKLRKEIESAKRLLQSGDNPLKVADGFIHEIFRIMEEGFHKRYPDLTEGEVTQKITETITFNQKLKNRRKRRRNQ